MKSSAKYFGLAVGP